jgi:hydrogenase-4 component E
MPTPPTVTAQLLNGFAAGLLLISFSMLSQRRTRRLIELFAWQGAILFVSTSLVAYSAGLRHLWYSAALILILKVVLLPLILLRLVQRLQAQWDTEPLLNIPTTMLLGVGLVIFAFGLAQPISALATTITRNTLGIALAIILLAFLMMITRRNAVSQVVGFLSMENGLFFAATSATYGMPMVVELGIALDVLVGVLILGIFFFQIREQFDSLDLHNLESLKED